MQHNVIVNGLNGMLRHVVNEMAFDDSDMDDYEVRVVCLFFLFHCYYQSISQLKCIMYAEKLSRAPANLVCCM